MAIPQMADNGTLSVEELQARIDVLQRVRLAHLPTPLEHCPRLSAALGGPEIYIKRDDMTGLALGGNKTRQLEFLFADLLATGADTVVAGAYTQSNWCRQITAAARKLGLDVALVLVHGEKGPALQGNLLLDRLMGADVTVVDIPGTEELTPHIEAKAAALRAAGRRPYVIAPFGPDTLALSAIGYVTAMVEIASQLAAAGIDADHLYLSAANMTPAGLAVGARALGMATRIVGITPIRWRRDRSSDIAEIATATARRLDLGFTVGPDEIINHDDYVGERYGVVTDGCRAAIKLVAESEGIILDPVYTGKAMAGLIDHIQTGRIRSGETVLFLHTGGTPALFAYADDLGLG